MHRYLILRLALVLVIVTSVQAQGQAGRGKGAQQAGNRRQRYAERNAGGSPPPPQDDAPEQKQQQQQQETPQAPPPSSPSPPNPPSSEKKQSEAEEVTPPPEKPQQPAQKVIISLALNWSDLWSQDASLEEVPQAERDANIREVLTEVANKMKRRNKVNELTEFSVMKVQQNLALAVYPQLSTATEIDLNLVANQLLQLDNSVLNVNIFVNNKPIQIVDLGMGTSSSQVAQPQGQQQQQQQKQQQNHEGIIEEPSPENQQEGHHPQPTGPSITEKLDELAHMLEEYDNHLNQVHEDSERNVERYHSQMDTLNKDYKKKRDAFLADLDNEFRVKTQDVESSYQQKTQEIQKIWDGIYYDRVAVEKDYSYFLEQHNTLREEL